MPRKGYVNRTDLIGSPKLPNTQAGGQPYGERAQQQAAQNVIPMRSTPVAEGAPQPPGAPQSPQPQLADILAQAQAHNGPGDVGPLDRPTERPNEPVTHGLPIGPGGGPEALSGVGAAAREGSIEQGTLQHLLSNMASSPGATSAIRDLAARAAGGQM